MNTKAYKTKLGFEFSLNAITILMGIAATIWLLKYNPNFLSMLMWYTNFSNWIMLISFVVYFIFLAIRTAKKIKEIPQGIYIFQLMGVVASALTLFGVLLFLLPQNPTWALFEDYNIFFHLLLPVFAILTFLLTEHNPKLKFRYLWICIIPITAYLIMYLINCYVRSDVWWKPDSKFDWYGIVAIFGKASPIVPVIMAGYAFFISWLLWLGNRNIHFGLPKPQPYFKKK